VSNTVALPVANERWVETTLGELAEYITSGSRDWSRYYADSGAIFIRTQDINRNRLSLKEVAFVKLPEKVEGKRSLVRKGDLLVTITGANVGKVAVVEGEISEAYVSQSVCLVRLKDPSLSKFVHLQLTARRGDKTTVEAMAYGLGRPVLNLENIRSAPIRIAPAEVQVVLVAEIEKQFSRLDEAVANLKRVKANLKRYKAAVLKAAVEGKLTEDWRKQHPDVEPASKFLERILAERRAKWKGTYKYKEPIAPDSGDLQLLPENWTWASVDQVAYVSLGKMLDKHKHRTGRQIPYLRNINVRWGRVDTEDLLKMFFKENELERYGLLPGDVLVCEGGEPGRAAVWDGRIPELKYQKALHRVRFYGKTEPRYLVFLLEFLANTGRLERWFTGSTIKHFTRESFVSMPISIPPLNEQKEIIAEVERRLSVIDELEATIEANLTRADRMRQAVLSQAFSGHLTNQRPGLLKGDAHVI
jgi:type I restriction enzyme, S subunit